MTKRRQIDPQRALVLSRQLTSRGVHRRALERLVDRGIWERVGAALLGAGGLHEPEPEVSIPRGTSLRRPWLIAHKSADLDLVQPPRSTASP